ncbi:4-hydroxy-tetrahydrodipicolinate reductase [Desulfitobacterium hafniense]|uniref:4-hydroxy-tetrahydrodipicolinate reductase n=1 Tax=Desulfitobacterium hafniense TaxID=49338 RepID=UPI00035E1192|nr:4-hydroxy-tetrahydrodipicolinate reductase [Desulfitobacterium hafniense]
MKKIRVFVSGAGGKMGREVVRTILDQEDMQLVGASDARQQGRDIGELLAMASLGIEITGPLEEAHLKETRADIVVDFTNPQSVLKNAKCALAAGVVPVLGTTGLDEADISEIRDLVDQTKVGAFIAPNFAIGAILMMRFAQEAAKYFPHVEIIELHHDQKLDAPSGTALKTVEWISEVRKPLVQGHPNEYEKIKGSRGGDVDGIHIHSVRLPGFIAHQEVIFGGLGQALTIRHDALSRETYMPGIMLAIRKAGQLSNLVIGLENFLE